MSYQIKSICCYCKGFMGFKSGGKAPNLVSHGICEDCLPIAKDEARRCLEVLIEKN